MLGWIKNLYMNFKRRRALIMDVQKVVNELCGHLSEFASEGKAFLKKLTVEPSMKYLYFIHLVNIQCARADFLRSELQWMKSKIRADAKDEDLLREDFCQFSNLMMDIDKLIKESVNVIPYSKMDEFYTYSYNVYKYLLTDVLNRYYGYA